MDAIDQIDILNNLMLIWNPHLQPVVTSAVEFFFGRVDARVPPSTTFHERLADLMLTSFSFAAEDPGSYWFPLHAYKVQSLMSIRNHWSTMRRPLP